jgi:hypothetical protein
MNSSFFYTEIWVLNLMLVVQTSSKVQMNYCPFGVGLLGWMKTQLIMTTPIPKFAPIDYSMKS